MALCSADWEVFFPTSPELKVYLHMAASLLDAMHHSMSVQVHAVTNAQTVLYHRRHQVATQTSIKGSAHQLGYKVHAQITLLLTVVVQCE